MSLDRSNKLGYLCSLWETEGHGLLVTLRCAAALSCSPPSIPFPILRHRLTSLCYGARELAVAFLRRKPASCGASSKPDYKRAAARPTGPHFEADFSSMHSSIPQKMIIQN